MIRKYRMKKTIQKRRYVFFAAFIFAVFVSGISVYCGSEIFGKPACAMEDRKTANTSAQVATVIKPLAKLIAGDNPSLKEALTILDALPNRKDGEQLKKRTIYNHEYELGLSFVPDSHEQINNIHFSFRVYEAGLQMKHITAALGPIKPEQYAAQKSYLTSYAYYRADIGVMAHVIVRTLTAPVDPHAPVLSIEIRRSVDKEDEESLKRFNRIQ